jgi:hypothetical protein
MRIHLGGHLAFYAPHKQAWLEVPLAAALPLRHVLEQLGVPPAEIAITLVNDVLVDLQSAEVTDADTVRLYPPSNGG